MKTIRCHQINDDIATISLDEVDIAPPGAGEVQIRVMACSVNFPDILMIQGKFPELGAGVVALAMVIILGNILGGPILLGRALAAGGSSAQGSEAPE